MPRTNKPISNTKAVERVRRKASEWYDQSVTAGKPKGWGRTYVEEDDNVYITAEQERELIAKWEADSTDYGILNQKGSGSSSGSQVDLKLQLTEDWGTWNSGTSPFVYHIPIDKYESPEDIAREEERKEQKRKAAERKLELEQEEAAEAARKAEAAKEAKRLEAVEKKKQQALTTDRNKQFRGKKPTKEELAAFDKDWLKKYGGRYK